MRVLLIRLDAPLMSFGDVRVDARGPIRDHPGLGQMTGLLGNALGYDHADAAALSRLQERLRFASRCDQSGERATDYQTVGLDQDFMLSCWTTSGVIEERKDGEASEGTHIRFRQFHNGRIQTVALTLLPADESPTLDDLASALDEPVRPLFIGRKPCLPAGRMNMGIIESTTLVAALTAAPRWSHRHRLGTTLELDAWWPEDPTTIQPERSHVVAVVDERDWLGQVVVGRRLVRHGRVNPPEPTHV